MANFSPDDMRMLAQELVNAIKGYGMTNNVSSSSGVANNLDYESVTKELQEVDRILNEVTNLSKKEKKFYEDRLDSLQKTQEKIERLEEEKIRQESEIAEKKEKVLKAEQELHDFVQRGVRTDGAKKRLAEAEKELLKLTKKYNKTIRDAAKEIENLNTNPKERRKKDLQNLINDRERVRFDKLQHQRNKIARFVGTDVASQFQNGSLMKAINGFKGGFGGGAIQIANIIGQAVSAISNAYTDYQLKNIDIQKEEISYKYDILNKELETASKLYKKRLEIYNKVLVKQFSSGLSFLTKGVQESAFESASNSLEIGSDFLKLRLESIFSNLNLETYKYTRGEEYNVNIDKLQREQQQGVTNAIIDGFDTVTGGFLGGVTGAFKSLTENHNKLQTARNEMYIQQLKADSEYVMNIRNIINEILQQHTETLKSFAQQGIEFTKQIEDIGLRIDKSIKSGAKLFGINPNKDYERNFRNLISAISVSSKNGTFYLDKNDEDIVKTQSSYIDTTGRNIEMDSKDIQKSFLMGELWDENTVNSLTGQMDYFNHSVEDSVDMFYEMYQTANKLGLSNKKYAEILNKNLKLAQKYTFKGGTEGLMKMAIWAQKTRFNLDSLDSMISKVQEGGLEGTITQAAQLQVLGGHAAMGSDPLAMQYEVWNDPEAFAERMYDMTREYASFNRETGEVDIKGLNAMMVAAIAKAQGRSPEDLRAELTQRIKNEQIDRTIISNNYSDEQKQLLYSKAQYDKEDGKWKINVNGTKQDIDNLKESDWEKITPIEENIEDYVYNIWDWLRNSKGVQNFYSTQLGFDTKDNTIAEIQQRISDDIKWFATKNEELQSIVTKGSDWVTKENEKWKNLLTNNYDKFSTALDSLTTGSDKLNTVLDNAITQFNVFSEAVQLSADEMLKKVKSIFSHEGIDIESAINASNANKNSIKNAIKQGFSANGLQQDKTKLLQLSELDFDSKEAEKLLKDIFGDGWSTQDDWLDDLSDIVKSRMSENRELFMDVLKEMKESGELDNLKLKKQSSTPKTSSDVAADLSSKAIQEGNIGQAMVYGFASTPAFKDGIVETDNKPMLTSASSITPIHDGALKLAKSDPKDTAIFAKNGGPFDTLFNDVFNKINSTYSAISTLKTDNVKETKIAINNPLPLQSEDNNITPRSMEYTMPLDSVSINKETHDKYTSNNSKLQIEPLKIELNGKLELTNSNGQSFDIMEQIRNNPMMLRELGLMLAEKISESINGGRAIYDGVVSTPRFNGMG